MADTSIEWTDATWNPVAGCTVLSPGCTNCYAMRMAAQPRSDVSPQKYRRTDKKDRRKSELDREAQFWMARSLEAPTILVGAASIFVNSMSDLFHRSGTGRVRGGRLARYGGDATAHLPDPH